MRRSLGVSQAPCRPRAIQVTRGRPPRRVSESSRHQCGGRADYRIIGLSETGSRPKESPTSGGCSCLSAYERASGVAEFHRRAAEFPRIRDASCRDTRDPGSSFREFATMLHVLPAEIVCVRTKDRCRKCRKYRKVPRRPRAHVESRLAPHFRTCAKSGARSPSEAGHVAASCTGSVSAGGVMPAF
jgi:hypothetical protein